MGKFVSGIVNRNSLAKLFDSSLNVFSMFEHFSLNVFSMVERLNVPQAVHLFTFKSREESFLVQTFREALVSLLLLPLLFLFLSLLLVLLLLLLLLLFLLLLQRHKFTGNITAAIVVVVYVVVVVVYVVVVIFDVAVGSLLSDKGSSAHGEHEERCKRFTLTDNREYDGDHRNSDHYY